MRRRIWWIFFCAAALTALLCGCGRDVKGQLIGTWECPEDCAGWKWIALYEDGSCEHEGWDAVGSWRVERGKQLRIVSCHGVTEQYRIVALSETMLTLDQGLEKVSYYRCDP